MPDIPGWDDEIHGSVRSLLVLVGDRLALCTTSMQHSRVRQYAAAYLARVRRLIIGMDILYESDMPDVLGGVLRMCLEAWVTGMWVLALGDDALAVLDADLVKERNRLIERADLDLAKFDPVDDASALPSVETRFQAVEKHLVAEGDATAGELVRWAYNVVYRAESGEGIHAGLASVLFHLTEESGRLGIAVARQEAGDGAGKVLWAATLLAMLARRVFQGFGIGTDDLDEMASPIQRLAVQLNDNPPDPDPRDS
jgi:hypothetical protein